MTRSANKNYPHHYNPIPQSYLKLNASLDA
jgi:hypothetical protein